MVPKLCLLKAWEQKVGCVWNVMAHALKPDSVFRRNRRVHLNRQGRQFSRILAAEVCASAVVMLDTPCSEVVWRVLATHSIRQFPLHFPYPCVAVCHHISTGIYVGVPWRKLPVSGGVTHWRHLRYVTYNEARRIGGGERWVRVRKTLSKTMQAPQAEKRWNLTRYSSGEPTSLKLGAAHVHWTFWSPFSAISDLLYMHKFNWHGPVGSNDDETTKPEPRYSDYSYKYYRVTLLHLMPNLRMNGAIPLRLNTFVVCIRKCYILSLTFTWLSYINLISY